MVGKSIFLALVSIALATAKRLAKTPEANSLVNAKASLVTYVTGAAVKQRTSVTVENHGKSEVSEYFVAIPNEWDDHLAIVGVKDNTGRLVVERTSERSDLAESQNCTFYKAKLRSALAADKGKSSVDLVVTIGLMHVLDPLPKEIKRTSKQYVVFEGIRHMFSPYPTKASTAKFVLATSNLKSFPKPVEKQDSNKLTYASASAPAFARDWMRFHFEFKGALLTVTELHRDIEVSHWGNVRFEDRYQLRHDGAKLKGAYEPGTNRRYMRIRDPSAIESIEALLPLNAHGVYYTDRIGNISSSNFHKSRTRSVLDFRTRYPLYGGWKTDFTIGYDVPSADSISIDERSGIYTLNLSFGLPMREPITEYLTTQIALPEGAFDVQVHCQFDIDLEPIARRFTYLDTQLFGGRPQITFHKKNVIHLHNEYFQITYRYSKNQLYMKPALLSGGTFLFLLVVTLISRITPTLSSDDEVEWKASRLVKEKKTEQKADAKTSVFSSSGKKSYSFSRDQSYDRTVGELKNALRECQSAGETANVKKIERALKKLKKQKSDPKRMNETVESLESQLS